MHAGARGPRRRFPGSPDARHSDPAAAGADELCLDLRNGVEAMMTCVAARHLSDDSRQRTPRWSLTPVRQASLINLPGRSSLRSGIFRRQNPVVARIPADADPAVRFILKTARGVLASRQLQVNANLGRIPSGRGCTAGTAGDRTSAWCGVHSRCSAMTSPSSRASHGSSRSRCRQSRPIHAALPARPRTLGAFTRGSG